jgi:hypothetical protein
MNAIQNIEDLIRNLREQGTPYYSVYCDKFGDANKMADNYRNEDNSMENAEKQLREYIAKFTQSGCNFLIWFSDKPQPARGGYKVQFYQPANANAIVQGIGAIQQPVQPQVDVNEAVAKALADFRKDLEMESLKKQIAELQTQNIDLQPTALDRVIGRLDPVIDFYLKKEFTPAIGNTQQHMVQEQKPAIEPNEAQSIAGKAIVSLSETRKEDLHEILTPLAEWAKNEKDLPAILLKLKTLQEQEPAKYEMAKTML